MTDSRKSKRRSEGGRKRLDQVEAFKKEVCGYFGRYLKASKTSQADLGRRLDLHKGIISKIVNIHTKDFTLDRLLKYLRVIHPELVPSLKKSSKVKKKKRKN